MIAQKIKASFNNLSPKGKKYLVWACIFLIMIVLIAFAYNSRFNNKTGATSSLIKKEEGVRFDPDLMSKTALKEQRRQMEDMQKEILRLNQDLKHLQKRTHGDQPQQESSGEHSVDNARRQPAQPLPPRQPATNEKNNADLPLIPTADQVERSVHTGPDPQQQLAVPLAPQAAQPTASKRRDHNQKNQSGIVVLSNPAAKDKPLQKKGRTVYLPPSFMEAMLLTGFDAATSGNGQNNPEPMLLRVQTPAVLPNDIKADLAGCFVVAEAIGRLDKERADVRTTTLACLNNQGDAVIDTPIKGFVTDSDSKVGLSGRVVSRMGAAVARTFVAGMFEGAGDALRQSATTTAVSPLGTTSLVDGSQVGKSALGTGLSDSANKLSDFYLGLAKQATPVIEVAAEKKITVVISEGKELEIKSLKHDEQYEQRRPRG